MENNHKRGKAFWTGWVLTGLIGLLFIFSAVMKFTHGQEVVAGWTKAGWPESLLTPIGVLELVCALIYLIPRVSVLGAILLTGYLGGAIATTLRVGDSVVMHPIFGVLVWGGIFLRDSRVRALIPFKKPQS